MGLTAVFIIVCFTFISLESVNCMGECYNPSNGNPQVCLPPFVNAAFGKNVEATNTCGIEGPEEYCLQTGATGVTKSCHYCFAGDPQHHHNASYLTDLNDDDRMTWWQSQTMLADVQHPHMVNLTLDLGKAFDITYVRLKFHSSRPESFSIYKKTCYACEWEPFQYYSGTCFSTYGMDNKDFITVEDEKKALCTEDYSDISPLTGGNVAFSTLEGRPSAYNFDKSAVLQDWVTAVSIRIVLNRINTFGDEVFSDSKVLKSYYYGITDFAVGGRCKCNGHASQCVLGVSGKLVCLCEHNTFGDDCEKCMPIYNDAPWRRGGDGDAHVCQPCDCNELADTCEFDADLYQATGHGGRCVNCKDNTAGVHCELCKDKFYREPSVRRCVACDCHPAGSLSEQCDSDGACRCKPGVTGRRCDQCKPGYYGLTEAGCSLCQCSVSGTEAGTVCDAVSGQCTCKLNVEGINCDRCKPGTMNIQYDNPYGCTACFCHGHSPNCEVAGGYYMTQIKSEFLQDDDGWRAAENDGTVRGALTFSGDAKVGADGLFFSAPAKFLGEQRFSYNQFLVFELSIEGEEPYTTKEGSGTDSILRFKSGPHFGHDLIIESNQYRVSIPLNGQNNPEPSVTAQEYRYRLHEVAGFQPRLSSFQFQKMLNNLTGIRIRAVNDEGFTFLHSVKLDSAEEDGNGPLATWIERCIAEGYLPGQAEACASGYTRATANGGVYSKCVPCDCNGHGKSCDRESGVCECEDNFSGEHCEICAVGYYMDDLRCIPCPCPDKISCATAEDGSVKCLSCPPGHYGNHCKFCMDGWFGVDACKRCTCNGNIDPNAIMNCDTTTGLCLKCIFNTTGPRCNSCLEGYYGNPLSEKHEERCQACECYSLGSSDPLHCDVVTGQCQCLPNVAGRRCNKCQEGYWDINGGTGCVPCGCNPVGASTGKCDQDSGQCDCLAGVTGQRCDRCLNNYYNISRDGCKACECNELGSLNLQCNDDGKCNCKTGVHGVKCEQCQENFHDLSSGCVECPPCYGLVQDAVNNHRKNLARLQIFVESIDTIPLADGDEFIKKLDQLKNTLEEIKKEANFLAAKRENVNGKLEHVHAKIEDMVVQVTKVESNMDACMSRVEEAEQITNKSKELLSDIDHSLIHASTQLDEASKFIEQAKAIALDSLNKENDMTKLANEAEAIADQHEEESAIVISTAQLALDTSRKALESIQEAINTLNGLIDSFDEMEETRLPAVSDLKDELTKFSGEILEKTKAAKRNATELLTEAEKLSLPDYDVDEIESEIQLVLKDIEATIPARDALNEEYNSGDLLIQADIDRAESLLENAVAIKDNTDSLIAQAHSARRTARDAVAKGDEAYKSMLEIEESLRSFSNQIGENKERAAEAMNDVPAIQFTIDEANRKANETEIVLGKAREDSVKARDKARTAQSNAETIQTKALEIRSEIERSTQEVEDIQNDSNAFKSQVGEAEQRLLQTEKDMNDSSVSVERAKNVADEIKLKAKYAKDNASNVINRLNELLEKLRNLDSIDEEEMITLENEYSNIFNDQRWNQFNSTIESLETQLNKQQGKINAYEDELVLLRKDVENVREIDAALPVNCTRATNVVEYTGP